MDRYGELYLSVSEFTAYCRDLHTSVSAHELEHYERERFMLPVARTIAPPEVHFEKWTRREGHQLETRIPAAWPALQLDDYTQIDQPFDTQLGRNPLITAPVAGDYRPWHSLTSKHPSGLEERRMESYYSYWQAHELYRVQLDPSHYRFFGLIRKVPDEENRRFSSMGERRPGYHLRHEYDVLSLFISRERRESLRTWAPIPVVDGVKTISDDEAHAHEQRLRSLARVTAAEGSLQIHRLYGFVRSLLELHHDYERGERASLLRSVERDLVSYANLALYAFDVEWERFAADASPVLHHRQQLRRLDPFTRNRDEAESTVAYLQHFHAIDTGSAELPALDAETERHALLQFCEEGNLLEVLEALGEFHFTSEQRRDSEPGFAIRRLRHSALAFESFAKAIAGDRIRSGQTLVPLMRDMTRQIAPSAGTKLTNLSVDSPGDAASRVRELTPESSPEQVASYVATCLACACLARNAAAHLPLLGWRSYEDQRTLEFLAGRTAQSFLELWRLATAVGWVRFRPHPTSRRR